ncbi:hypothetical protein SUGI_0705660 [Cryptomeria japonica]|nr:hypothetical protein SUGI_0705660 [Cryptomeria japonica]
MMQRHEYEEKWTGVDLKADAIGHMSKCDNGEVMHVPNSFENKREADAVLELRKDIVLRETQEVSYGDNDLACTPVFTKFVDLPADAGVLLFVGSGEAVSTGLRRTSDAGVLPLQSIVSSEAKTSC